MGVAHLALDLRSRREGRHRVDDHDIQRTRADEHVGDLQGLLAGVRLADEELVDIDPDGLRVHRVHRVLGVDVGANAAVALCFGDHVHGQGGLTRGLRAEDLHDSATGQAADAERNIQGQGAGLHGLDGHRPLLAHPHDGALAELLVDGRQCDVQCLVAVSGAAICAHWCSLPVPAVVGGEAVPLSRASIRALPCGDHSGRAHRTVRKGCDRVSPAAPASPHSPPNRVVPCSNDTTVTTNRGSIKHFDRTFVRTCLPALRARGAGRVAVSRRVELRRPPQRLPRPVHAPSACAPQGRTPATGCR